MNLDALKNACLDIARTSWFAAFAHTDTDPRAVFDEVWAAIVDELSFDDTPIIVGDAIELAVFNLHGT